MRNRFAHASKLGMAGIRALRGAGLFEPVAPRRALGMAAGVIRCGACPAVLAAVAAARWPTQVAIIDERGELTYAELDRRVDALASALARDFGIGPTRALAVMCRNHRGFVEAMLAAGRLGADLVVVNTELPPPQLAQVLGRHALGALVHDDEFAGALDAAGFDGLRLVADGAHGSSSIDLLVSRDWPSLPRSTRRGRVVLLTSGTTGAPKGVPRAPSPAALTGLVITCLERLGLRTREPLLISPPLFHGFGIAYLALGFGVGATVVLQRRFDPEAAIAAIERHRIAAWAVVPVMLQRALGVPDLRARTSSLRAVLSGGAPLSPALSTAFMDAAGDVLFNGYGSSEVGLATLGTPADLRAAPGTVGKLVLGVRARVLDDAGRPVPVGETGRLFVGGPLAFEGYVGGGSKETIDGMLSTGDVGHIDAEGRLFVEGRADDMIVSGGENVFPQAVEDVLARHPAVSDAAVIGVEDREFGQRLHAFVVAGNESVSAENLNAYLRGELARYEVPRQITFLDELPRNATGKLLRSRLRELLEAR